MLAPDERAALIERREMEFPQRWPNHPDFCPADGICWSCKADLVERYKLYYPTAFITGCSACFRSYCD